MLFDFGLDSSVLLLGKKVRFGPRKVGVWYQTPPQLSDFQRWKAAVSQSKASVKRRCETLIFLGIISLKYPLYRV